MRLTDNRTQAERVQQQKEAEERRRVAMEKQRLRNIAIDKLGAHDLFGQRLEVGDTVAWPTSAGRAVGITVGVITKINFKEERSRISGRMYSVQARPLKAGYAEHYTKNSYTKDPVTGKYVITEKERLSPVTIQKVQNLVRVEVPVVQLEMDLQ